MVRPLVKLKSTQALIGFRAAIANATVSVKDLEKLMPVQAGIEQCADLVGRHESPP
jgi:hypothetical protein